MDDDELVAIVGALRVRIDLVRYAVSGPASVGNADVGIVDGVQLESALVGSDFIFQSLHFAALLDQDHAITVRGVDANTCRVIASVLEPLKTLDERLNKFTSRLRRQVVEISKNSAHVAEEITGVDKEVSFKEVENNLEDSCCWRFHVDIVTGKQIGRAHV